LQYLPQGQSFLLHSIFRDLLMQFDPQALSPLSSSVIPGAKKKRGGVSPVFEITMMEKLTGIIVTLAGEGLFATTTLAPADVDISLDNLKV